MSNLDAKFRAKDDNGKGLSEEDFRTSDSQKLRGLPAVGKKLPASYIPKYIQVFEPNGVDAYLSGFIVDIVIWNSQPTVSATDIFHIENIRRNKQYSGYTRSMVTLGVNGVRISSWFQDNYVEPLPDENGDIFDTVQLNQEAGQGATKAYITVNWAKVAVGVEKAYGSVPSLAKINPKVYLNGAWAISKTNLPSATSPSRIYTFLNDIDTRGIFTSGVNKRYDLVRDYSLRLYIDKFLTRISAGVNFPYNTDVRFTQTKSDKFPLFSKKYLDNDVLVQHPTYATTIAQSIGISGGTNYNDKTVTLTQCSTRESVAFSGNKTVALLEVGDSTTAGLNTEVGVPAGYASKSWGVVHEMARKAKIDYLIEQGYSLTDIQNDNISAGDKLKFKYIAVGAIDDSTSVDNYTLNYRGVTNTYTVRAEGIGSWAYYMYMNKPVLCMRSQGTWDAIGLGNGTGTDYTGTDAQKLLFDRTAWNPSALVDTTAFRSWCAGSPLFYTGSTRTDYVNKLTDVANNPTNRFYDHASTRTAADSSNNIWNIKFSIAKYLSRYRTLQNDGTRLAWGNGAVGTLITSTTVNTLDVTLPTHIIIQSCQNDQNVLHFGLMAKALATAIKTEYSTQAYGIVPNIALSIIDGAGTYFPQLYGEFDTIFIGADEFQRSVHNDNLARLQTEVTSEDTNKIFALANTHIIPTAKSIITRVANSPDFDLSGDENDQFGIAIRSSAGIKAHINSVGHRNVGIHKYAWLLYTLSL